MKDYISLNKLALSGELGTKSPYKIRKFILKGVNGKKLHARIEGSYDGAGGQRFFIPNEAVVEFKKHLKSNPPKVVKTIW